MMEMKDVIELLKCSKDMKYFASEYVKLHDGLPFMLDEFSKDIIDRFENGDVRIEELDLTRMIGKTTVASAILLHYIIFNEYKTIGLIFSKMMNGKEFLKTLLSSYNSLPDFFKEGLEIEKELSDDVQFSNGNRILISTPSSHRLRGRTVNFFYIEEIESMNKEELMASIIPCLSVSLKNRLLSLSSKNV